MAELPDVLSQSEIDALLTAVSEPRGRDTVPADVRYYDFLRPERASSAQMRALTDLHEAAARTMAAALGGALGTNVDCRLQAFEQTTWGEFAMGMPNPTCFAVVAAKRGAPVERAAAGDASASGSAGARQRAGLPGGLHGARLALEIGPAILYPMIERLLGGPPDSGGEAGGEPPARPLTAIERRVAGTLLEVSLQGLAGVWGRVKAVELELLRIETNPQIVSVAPPEEMAAMATFELSVGRRGGAASEQAGRAGLMHLCMPFSTFGALFEAAAEGAASPAEGANAATCTALMRVPVRVEAYRAWTRMTLREIAGLSVGDVIRTGRSTGDSMILTVAGLAKFTSSAGEFRGRKAARVSGRIGGPPVGFGAGRAGRKLPGEGGGR